MLIKKQEFLKLLFFLSEKQLGEFGEDNNRSSHAIYNESA